jgi:hypothetical protein
VKVAGSFENEKGTGCCFFSVVYFGYLMIMMPGKLVVCAGVPWSQQDRVSSIGIVYLPFLGGSWK